MTKKEYNGWFNYETWLFNLWHDSAFTDYAEECYSNAEADSTFTGEENATFALSDQIKDFSEEMLPEEIMPKNGFLSDLIGAGLQEINFHEIAKHYIDCVEKEIAA